LPYGARAGLYQDLAALPQGSCRHDP
jgi:hypothetical protein